MEKYQCNRCDAWVEDKDIDVFHFRSVHKPHTLLSTQMCLSCRDEVFDFIRNKTKSRTITIPKTELPQHHSVRLEGPLPCVEVGDDQSALLLRIRFYNQEDAQKWREWVENNIFWTGGHK